MPNLDGGHYFLTVLAPIRTEIIQYKTVGWTQSHRAQLAQKLSLLATGKQTRATPPDAWPSPFSRNTLNHLARFVIIDTPPYNGRIPENSLLAAIEGVNTLDPQPVDTFSRPYLLFGADIDAPTTGDAALRSYTDALWTTMKDDLKVIFGHCLGFDGIETAEAFHDYIRKCQVETTMPFNDYWANDELKPDPEKAKSGGPGVLGIVTLVAKVAACAAAVWGVALLLDVVLNAFGWTGPVQRCADWLVYRVGIWLLGLIVVAAIAIWIAYRVILAKGAKPFPTAPGSDLPSVLKALFVQQHFTDFAIEAQGLDDAALHARFGEFLAKVKPDQAEPTQPPGEFHAPALETPR